ncbi:MAG: hypothetical protein KDC46_08395 [Thermoleophilia bacterium]|nr:hypothetical protein [Thermoleophilia bacterium]
MSQQIAVISVLVAWTCVAFAMLQLWTAGHRRAILGPAVVLLVGIVVAYRHGHGTGLEWLRSERLRSDAYALALLVATLATAAGWACSGSARRSAWSPIAATVAAFSSVVGGAASLALGRSSGYWDFCAVIVGGGVLALVAGATAARRGTTPDVRIVWATAAVIGVVSSLAGGMLLAAWRSLE